MSRKKLSRNATCPCGSGKKYGDCCYDKGFDWVSDEDGNIGKSVPVSDELAEVITQQHQKFVEAFMKNHVLSMVAIRIAFASLSMAGLCIAEVPHVKIGRFPQEVATSFTVADGLPSNDVRAVHLDSNGTVWVNTSKGWAVLRRDRWEAANPPPLATLRGHVSPKRYAAIRADVNQRRSLDQHVRSR